MSTTLETIPNPWVMPDRFDCFLGIDPGKEWGACAIDRAGVPQWSARPRVRSKADGFHEFQGILAEFVDNYRQLESTRRTGRMGILVSVETWMQHGQPRNLWQNGYWHGAQDFLLASLLQAPGLRDLPILRPTPDNWKTYCGIPANYGPVSRVKKPSGQRVPSFIEVFEHPDWPRFHHHAPAHVAVGGWTPDEYAAYGMALFAQRLTLGLEPLPKLRLSEVF